jgi:hypothetical protein
LPFINNNLAALGVALGTAVLLAAVIIVATAGSSNIGSRRSIQLNGHAVFGLGLSALLLIIGVVWYVAFRSSFLDHAHGGGAAALFALIGVVILINGISTPHRMYGWIYIAIAVAMALTVVVVFVIGRSARVNLSEADVFGNHCVVAVSSFGSLIQTAVGSAGGSGGLRTKRSGCSA